MKNVLTFFAILGLLCACNRPTPTERGGTIIKGTPDHARLGGTIRIRFSEDHCPVGVQDFEHAGGTGSAVGCRVGNVVKSATACRLHGKEVQWDSVPANEDFTLIFKSDSPVTDPTKCGHNPDKFQSCPLVDKLGEYSYEIKGTGTNCVALDPHIIIY